MVGLSAWSADVVGLSGEAPQRAPGPACGGLFKVMFLNEATILLQIYSGSEFKRRCVKDLLDEYKPFILGRRCAKIKSTSH